MVKQGNNKDFNGFRIVKVIVLSLIFIVTSCDLVLLKDDELTIKKEPYLGNVLRVDGYYYDTDANNDNVYIDIYYRNGVMMTNITISMSEISDFELECKNGSLYASVKKDKTSWGVFKIDSNKIQSQNWVPAEVLPAFTSRGIILNDTTFKITESERVGGTSRTTMDLTYRFKQLSPKPDSTNDFIK